MCRNKATMSCFIASMGHVKHGNVRFDQDAGNGAEVKDTVPVEVPFKPKRGRPTADQSVAIERAIRQAATRAFLANGYEGTSMEAVAGQAGVPKSTLYKRFPDKRALLRAVLGERVSAWREMESAHCPDDDLESRLKRLAVDILRHATTPEVKAFWLLASTAWGRPDEASERQAAIGYSRMMARLELEIRQFGPPAGIVARDPRQVAVALMTMLAGWIEYVAPTSDRPEEDGEKFAHASVEMLIRGTAAW
jgi:TetR/AcrR family transcriptional regulator, mexJK operon transcriptional repressor